MATFDFEGISIYFEDHGSGEPLVVLNGIFMSCASWRAFVPSFSAHNRLLLLDLADQGASGKLDHEYTQELQERVVLAFLDHLGLDSAHLCGVSYGGEVALRVATRHPDRVDKLVLANTTAFTSAWLRDIGRSWEHAMNSHDGHVFFKTCIPVVYSPGFYEANYEWISAREDLFVPVFTPEVYDAFARLTRSAETHDERAGLGADQRADPRDQLGVRLRDAAAQPDRARGHDPRCRPRGDPGRGPRSDVREAGRVRLARPRLRQPPDHRHRHLLMPRTERRAIP